MAFNLSGVDADQYFVNTLAANISLFVVLVLPSLLLCILCALALIFSKEINKKIRLLLVNIFAAEICKWMAYTVFYLTWPVRLLYQDDFTCKLFFSLYAAATVQTFMAGALYAINVYIFIKHGKKKLKWRVVIPLAAISWIVTFVFAAMPYIEKKITSNGFCVSNPDRIIYKIYATAIGVLILLFLGVQIICGILTVVYIRRNTLEENTDIKKAVAKVQAYFAAASILSFINNIGPAFVPLIREAIADNDTTTTVAVNYLILVVFSIPAIATPIVTIALLKPVRLATKTMIKKAYTLCCRKHSVAN